jgi:hypothetical protein
MPAFTFIVYLMLVVACTGFEPISVSEKIHVLMLTHSLNEQTPDRRTRHFNIFTPLVAAY